MLSPNILVLVYEDPEKGLEVCISENGAGAQGC
jgi:hypothetical protein